MVFSLFTRRFFPWINECAQASILFLKNLSCYCLIDQSSCHVYVHSIIRLFIRQTFIEYLLFLGTMMSIGVTILGQSKNELLPANHEVAVLDEKNII